MNGLSLDASFMALMDALVFLVTINYLNCLGVFTNNVKPLTFGMLLNIWFF